MLELKTTRSALSVVDEEVFEVYRLDLFPHGVGDLSRTRLIKFSLLSHNFSRGLTRAGQVRFSLLSHDLGKASSSCLRGTFFI